VAKRSGCDAIHPGYGFLSENPDLAAACESAGITFVGPSADVLALAGNKARAIEAAQAAKSPVLVSTFTTDKYQMAPKVMTASLLADFRKPYVEILRRIVKGERGGYYEFAPGTGMDLSEIRNVSPDVAAKVTAVFREVVAGKPLPEIMDRVVGP